MVRKIWCNVNVIFDSSGQKFDLIILDTSQENNTYVQAPSDSFVKHSVVRYFPEILKKTGKNCFILLKW